VTGLSRLVLATCLSAGACAQASPPPDRASTTAPAPLATSAPAAAPAPPPPRPQLDGRAFPDKVLALTWDDGPDQGTVALARYLHDEHVPATFFVVGEWVPGLSEEPGQGAGVFATGHRHLPVLGEIVALGHRLANHTLNHALLGDAPAERVVQQLRDDQAAITPYQKGAVALFRVPGGAWSASASAAVDGDPVLARLVGPVRWDVDGKDWEGSLYCHSDRPAAECEPAAPGGASRAKPAVTARRYLEQAEQRGHGVVLLHDRVGHVGSSYALDVARALIPALKRRGFVFAAPVLRFSPLAPRPDAPPPGSAPVGGAASALAGFAVDPASLRLGDVNGDGQADACGRTPEGIVCALANGHGYLAPSIWLPEMSDAAGWAPHGATITLSDVNGDGRADVCGRGPDGPVCALAP
jgi:peptidoglycan/xylan/chitin deacetylase (PgdA/CDA1 family)